MTFPSPIAKAALLATVVVVLVVVRGPWALAARERPNVVLILSDDQGYGDVGCYGCPDIRTPELDALARDGVRLTQYYANGPNARPRVRRY